MSLVLVNLKDWRSIKNEMERKRFIWNIAKSAILGVLIIFAANNFIDAINDEEQRLNSILKKEIAVLDSKIKTISKLNAEKKAMINRLDTIEKMQSKRPLIVKQINSIQSILPEDVYYTSLTYSGNRFLIEASATNDLYISEMMRHIDQSDVFTSPILRNVTDQGGERAFNMSFKTNKQEKAK